MPAEFLRDVVIQDRKKGRRLSMVPVSIAAHAIVGLAVLIIPLAAEVEPPPVAKLIPSYMSAMPVPPPPPAPRVVSQAAADFAKAPIRAGDTIGPEVEHPPAPPSVGVPTEGGIGDGFDRVGIGTAIVAPPPPPPPPPPKDEHRPVRPGGDIKPPRKIVDATPVYPEIARQAGVGGLVILEATINEDGIVDQVRVLRSDSPLLESAAIAAVRRWRYTPTLLNGKPVSVLMTVTVNFERR